MELLDKEEELHTLKELYDKTINLRTKPFTLKNTCSKSYKNAMGMTEKTFFHNTTNYINKAYYEERSDDPIEESI